MLKYSVLISILCFLFLFSCNSGSNIKAKKLKKFKTSSITVRSGFDPKKHGFSCDSMNVKSILKDNKIEQLIVLSGSFNLDTLLLKNTIIPSGAENDIRFSDYNFDGFCEFVIPDKKSAMRGGMNYYYFIFDTLKANFIEINTLPKFIGNFKLDVKNQRVKIYCPDDACFAYYKFDNQIFNLVQGEYKENP